MTWLFRGIRGHPTIFIYIIIIDKNINKDTHRSTHT